MLEMAGPSVPLTDLHWYILCFLQTSKTLWFETALYCPYINLMVTNNQNFFWRKVGAQSHLRFSPKFWKWDRCLPPPSLSLATHLFLINYNCLLNALLLWLFPLSWRKLPLSPSITHKHTVPLLTICVYWTIFTYSIYTIPEIEIENEKIYK